MAPRTLNYGKLRYLPKIITDNQIGLRQFGKYPWLHKSVQNFSGHDGLIICSGFPPLLFFFLNIVKYDNLGFFMAQFNPVLLLALVAHRRN